MSSNFETPEKPSRLGMVILWATAGASAFRLLTSFIPVYETAFTSAIYELLWLPAMFILYIVPLFSFLLWAGEKFKVKSVHLYALLLAAVTVAAGYFIVKYR